MRWLIGIVISALLLTWAFYGIDFQPLAEIFLTMPLWPIGIMGLSIVAFFAIKALRWHFLLQPIAHIATDKLVPAMLIGTAFNYIFFGYLGEFVRTYVLSKQQKLKKGPILMTIVLERIFDLWTLLLFLGIATLLSPELTPLILNAGYIALGLACVATLFLFFPKFLLKLVSFNQTLHREVSHALDGLLSIRHPKLLAAIVTTSLLQWLIMMCGCNWMATIAVGIQLPPWALLGPMGLMILGMTLPSSPGQLGVIEMCYILGLKVWGIPKEPALAAGLLFHAILYGSVILVAFFLAKREHFDFSLYKKINKFK